MPLSLLSKEGLSQGWTRSPALWKSSLILFAGHPIVAIFVVHNHHAAAVSAKVYIIPDARVLRTLRIIAITIAFLLVVAQVLVVVFLNNVVALIPIKQLEPFVCRDPKVETPVAKEIFLELFIRVPPTQFFGARVALPPMLRALFPLPFAEALTNVQFVFIFIVALFRFYLPIVSVGPPVIAFTVDGVIKGVPPAFFVRALVGPPPEVGALLPYPFAKAVFVDVLWIGPNLMCI